MQPYEILEREIARWVNTSPDHIAVCNSGTSALHLSLECMQLSLKRSQVLIPDYTMIACPRAVTLAGLTPVFADCKEEDLTIDPELMEQACSDSSYHIDAVMPVHIYGRRCDMGAITTLAKKYDIRVIEDMAECHGVLPHPDSDAACYSFYANKIVAGEEGGAVYFKDPTKADLARKLRSLGFTEQHDFYHIPRGHNYRLANSLAHLIIDSLKRYPTNIADRRRIELLYDRYCPDEWRTSPRDAPWVYDLRVPHIDSHTQANIVTSLNELGIAARQGFKPMTMQDEYTGYPHLINGTSYLVAREVFYLPLTYKTYTGVNYSDEQIEERVKLAFTTVQDVVSRKGLLDLSIE